MFRWLGRLLSPARDADGYTAGEREIYLYFDGTRMRRADPVALQRRLADAADLDWESDCAGARRGKRDARQRLEEAVKVAFEVEDFRDLGKGDSVGLTRDEMHGLLDDFTQYVEALKKKRPVWPIVPPFGA